MPNLSMCATMDVGKYVYYRLGKRYEVDELPRTSGDLVFEMVDDCGEPICLEETNTQVTSIMPCKPKCTEIVLSTIAEQSGVYVLLYGNTRIEFGGIIDTNLRLPYFAGGEFTILDPNGDVVINEYSEVTEVTGIFCKFVVNRAYYNNKECMIRLYEWRCAKLEEIEDCE